MFALIFVGVYITFLIVILLIEIYKKHELERDNEKLSGKVIRLSAREDIDLPIEEHLIVELYSK